MTQRKLLWTGIVGSAVAAVCCFTPLLVVALGGIGLAAWLGWLDWVLFPALALFLSLTIYAIILGARERGGGDPGSAA